jgi:polar amino acid transport system substrate-binding protein
MGSAIGQTPSITVSSNNTPLDRKALEELSQEAFSRIGMEFRLVSLPPERSLFAANLGEVDGEGLRVAGLGSQYLNLVQVPERYMSVSIVAFTKDQSIQLDKGWDSLKPYSIAVITGWTMFETNAIRAKAINRVERPEQLFRMLDGGRVDVVLYTRADGLAMVRSQGFKGIVPLSPALKGADMYLYLNKKHEAIVPRLAKALRDMKADGTYSRIMSSIKAD